MKNEDIIYIYVNEKGMRDMESGRLEIRKGVLYSYDMPIAVRKVGVFYLNKDAEGFSATTTRHYHLLKRLLEEKGEKYMEVSKEKIDEILNKW